MSAGSTFLILPNHCYHRILSSDHATNFQLLAQEEEARRVQPDINGASYAQDWNIQVSSRQRFRISTLTESVVSIFSMA
jgi:hypothetical protein